MRFFFPLIAAALAATPVAATNLITNGSFETGPAPGAFTTLGAGSTAINGWTVTSGTIDYIGSYWNAGAGNRSLDMNGNSGGSISQIIGTITGRSYSLSFLIAANPDNPVDKTMTVTDGSFLFGVGYAGVPNPLSWTPIQFDFSALGPSTTITFTGTNAGPWGMALDDVSVSLNAIPEPQSWVLLITGFALVGVSARRRQRIAA
jgi:choice-of-anchor C domain-containing protein